MDKFFLNNIIRKIWEEDFNQNAYDMAKHLGHVNKQGKVTSQKVDNWIKNKTVIKPDSFVSTLVTLGYNIEMGENKISFNK